MFIFFSCITNSNGVATVTVNNINAETTFTASYFNVSDTCIVTVSRVIYQPALEGTESITTIRTYTPTISNNELVSGCGYLSDGWDNTIDWELTFEYCQRDYPGVQQWQNRQLNWRCQGSSPSGNLSVCNSSTQSSLL